VLAGNLSKAAGASLQVAESGMAQINAAGLEGNERDKAIAALNGLSAATYNNVNTQQAAAAKQAESADLVSRNHQALARDAEMAAQGITEMGVSLKNIVHDTTASAAELNGKTVGSGMTITGMLTEQGYQLAVADAVRKSMLASAQQRLTAFRPPTTTVCNRPHRRSLAR
jgi:hypothetical protein